LDYVNAPADEFALHCFRGADELAWAEFIKRFHPLIASVVIRVARHWGESTPQAIEDLVQETYLKLCTAGLHGFRSITPNHPEAIYGYIKVFTANLVQDHFKVSRAQKRGGGAETTSFDEGSWEIDQQKSERPEILLERKLLLQKVAACLAATSGANSKRDQRIFWLYYRVGLSARVIATLPTINLSTKGVESTILRLTRMVRQQLRSPNQQSSTDVSPAKGTRAENSL
jgi:RNA polymerase sigma-70 factor (ECF subfamily)